MLEQLTNGIRHAAVLQLQSLLTHLIPEIAVTSMPVEGRCGADTPSPAVKLTISSLSRPNLSKTILTSFLSSRKL